MLAHIAYTSQMAVRSSCNQRILPEGVPQMTEVFKFWFSNVQAYYAVARRLKENKELKVKRGRISEDFVDQLDSSLTEAHRVLKQKLGEAGAAEALTSQLLSVLSSEDSLDQRLQATFETILPWANEIKSGIPLEVLNMYARGIEVKVTERVHPLGWLELTVVWI